MRRGGGGRRGFPLHEAVAAGDADRVRHLLQVLRDGEQAQPPPPQDGKEEEEPEKEQLPPFGINDRNEEGLAPLHIAARQGQVDCLELLLSLQGQEESIDVNLLTEDGLSPIQLALYEAPDEEQRKERTVRLLCQHGADTNVQNAATGTPPLWDAVYAGLSTCIPILVEHGADVQCQSPEGETILFAAIANEQVETVAYLLSATGAEAAKELANKSNLEGYTALHLCCTLSSSPSPKQGVESAAVKMARLLLEKGGAEASLLLRNEKGNTPLMEAIEMARSEKEAEGDVVDAEEITCNSALCYLLQSWQRKADQKLRARNPTIPPADGADLFTSLLLSSSSPASSSSSSSLVERRPLLWRIVEYLQHPNQLCEMELVSKDVRHCLLSIGQKSSSASSSSSWLEPWHALYLRWFRDEKEDAKENEERKSRKQTGKIWGTVYGQGSSFYAMKLFQEEERSEGSSWKSWFMERYLLETCDPSLHKNIDGFLCFCFHNALSFSINKTAEQRSESEGEGGEWKINGPMEALQSTILFARSAFEYRRYRATCMVHRATARRMVVRPVPFQRTTRGPLEREGKAHAHLLCFYEDDLGSDETDASFLTFEDNALEGDEPRLLVGIRSTSSGNVGREKGISSSKQQLIQEACEKYRCDVLYCSVSEGRGVHAIFERLISLCDRMECCRDVNTNE
ncbi:Ankyrin repeat and SOCS box protein 3 [Balamuthia mandrillaris]